jgi:hypothetical protein
MAFGITKKCDKQHNGSVVILILAVLSVAKKLFMLSDIMLHVVMLSVVMLSVVMIKSLC